MLEGSSLGCGWGLGGGCRCWFLEREQVWEGSPGLEGGKCLDNGGSRCWNWRRWQVSERDQDLEGKGEISMKEGAGRGVGGLEGRRCRECFWGSK